MTEVEEGLYQITFNEVDEYDNYTLKFAVNGAWTHNFGGSIAVPGVENEAVYNGGDITVDLTGYELSNVTITLDLRNFDMATGTGATFTVNAEPIA